MKQNLTIEQSAELIKRGVSANKASDTYVGRWEHSSEGSFADPESVEPLFTLTDLLSLLPKEIEVDFPNADGGIDTEDCYLCTQWCINGDCADNHQWSVFYTPGFQVVEDFCAKELIDALYELLLWAIDHNHVKLD